MRDSAPDGRDPRDGRADSLQLCLEARQRGARVRGLHRVVGSALQLTWQASHRGFLVTALLQVIGALSAAALVLVGQLALNAILAADQGSSAAVDALFPVTVLLAVVSAIGSAAAVTTSVFGLVGSANGTVGLLIAVPGTGTAARRDPVPPATPPRQPPRIPFHRRRRADPRGYLRTVLTGRDEAKEVRAFGAEQALRGRHEKVGRVPRPDVRARPDPSWSTSSPAQRWLPSSPRGGFDFVDFGFWDYGWVVGVKTSPNLDGGAGVATSAELSPPISNRSTRVDTGS